MNSTQAPPTMAMPNQHTSTKPSNPFRNSVAESQTDAQTFASDSKSEENETFKEVELATLQDYSTQLEAFLSHEQMHIERLYDRNQSWLGNASLHKYEIKDDNGAIVGYMREKRGPDWKAAWNRQMMIYKRRFTIEFFDANENLILMVKRGTAWLNSTVSVYVPVHQDDGSYVYKQIGFSHEIFTVLRRKYELNVGSMDHPHQFGVIDAKTFAFTFPIKSTKGDTDIAEIRRLWMGFGRETYSSSNKYVVNLRSLPSDQRAVVLCCLVLIDFNHFTRPRRGN